MVLRIARHTNDLEKIEKFYTQILGLENFGKFRDHDNYNGIFLGKKDFNWHLEFTQSNKKANHEFDEDDVLVFYPKTKKQYDYIFQKIIENNIKKIKAKNPYWNKNGFMFCDPDGYRIVLSAQKINV